MDQDMVDFPSTVKIDRRCEKEGWLVVSSVDRVALRVVQALSVPFNDGKNIDIQDGIMMRDFWNIVNSKLGEENKMKEIDAKTWFDTIQRYIEKKAEKHPLLPVQGFLDKKGNLGLDCKPESGDGEMLKGAVERNVEVLMGCGFFL